MNKINYFFTQLARLGFLLLLAFELLNFFKVFHIQLHFSWLTLAFLTIIAWLTWEIIFFYLKRQKIYSLAIIPAFLFIFSLFIDVLGNVSGWYGQIEWYDRLAHLIAGGAIGGAALAVLWGLNSSGKIKLSVPMTGLFAFSLTTVLGALYEIEEYFEDKFLGTHRLGDGPDVADDLFLDMTGALVVIIIIMLCLKFIKKTKTK